MEQIEKDILIEKAEDNKAEEGLDRCVYENIEDEPDENEVTELERS